MRCGLRPALCTILSASSPSILSITLGSNCAICMAVVTTWIVSRASAERRSTSSGPVKVGRTALPARLA
ncbi:MAG: hypothetical protein E5V57_11760, partial [Mesorhizobium sp.]